MGFATLNRSMLYWMDSVSNTAYKYTIEVCSYMSLSFTELRKLQKQFRIVGVKLFVFRS